MEAVRLLAIDASNLAHRAFHSSTNGGQNIPHPNLVNSRIKSMVGVLLRDVDPLRLIAAFDSGDTFRHRLYPLYKAHRKEKPVEFAVVMDELPDLLRSLGSENFMSPDHEADDALATIADQCIATNIRLLIASNDRDLLQLAFDAGHKTGTYILHHHAGSYHALGPQEVEAKMGVPPHRVALCKAIQGDVSDNIKGISGLGEVAAKRLASQYASMGQVFKNLDRLQKSDRTKLEAAGYEHAALMERLTTLVFDAPLQAV